MAMDIPRPELARKRRRKRILYGAGLVVAVALATLGLSRLKPAPPSVDRATVWIDTVHRGNMLREVRGLGTLVPQQVRSIPSITDGRVEDRPVLPGTTVKANTVLLVLSNPQLEQQALDAKLQLQAAEADYANQKANLQTQYLQQQANAATIAASYRQAKLQADADKQLYQQGLSSNIIYEKSAANAQGLAESSKMAQQQLEQYTELIRAQLAAQQAKVDQARALAQLKAQQVADLHVSAGMNGVLQELDVDLGQEVQPGATLAKVVDPTQLWAELNIPETEAKDLLLGQTASVDTHNGIIGGHVIRINPAPVNGTVAVDVSLDGALPKGARPNLSVEGTILIEKLTNVLYVGRPVHAEPESTIGLFKLTVDGKEAVRVPVKIGRVSVNTVEILTGLNVGDQVILSDMSAQDNFDRIRLQ
jgi:HlyD family secretion protein